MQTPTTGARALAIVSGTALVAAAAWLTIDATGGPTTPHAKLVAATALALVAGAIAIGQARRATFAALLVGLLCAEAFGLVTTSERIVAAREAAQSPLRAAGSAHAAAQMRVDAAKAAVDEVGRAAIAKAATKDCQSNCRKLLEAAKTNAADELDAARAALAKSPAPADAAPLATRLGLPSWALDLVAAALGSLAANGLGCALISFGVHARPSGRMFVAPARQIHAPAVAALAPVAPDAPANRPDASAAANVIPLQRPPGRSAAPDDAVDWLAAAAELTADRPVAPVSRKARVLADIRRDVAAGRSAGSQAELCLRHGIARATMSDWLGEWERARLIPPRRTIGRCKAIA